MLAPKGFAAVVELKPNPGAEDVVAVPNAVPAGFANRLFVCGWVAPKTPVVCPKVPTETKPFSFIQDTKQPYD